MTNKLHKLFLTSRPVSWINTAYPFAAGYLVTARRLDLIFVIGTLFYLIPYNLLMYGVNDVYDYESDIRNPRKGGIEGAKLSRNIHHFVLTAAYVCALPFVVFLLLSAHRPYGLVIFLLNIFLVLAYSLPKLRFKERPFIDSATSSSHFVGPLIFALSFSSYRPNYGLIVLAFFLWGMASHAFGAVQDIHADKQGGIGSIATVIGAPKTVRLAIGLYAVSILLLAHQGWLGLIVAGTESMYIANIWPFRNLIDRDAERSNAGWRRFIKLNQVMGFIVTIVLIYIFKFQR